MNKKTLKDIKDKIEKTNEKDEAEIDERIRRAKQVEDTPAVRIYKMPPKVE